MKSMDRALSGAVIIGSIAVCPSLAEAHSPINGIGTFYGHFLHPLAVPSQALLLIAAALLLGQQDRKGARVGLVTLGLGFVAGLMVSSAGVVAGVREQLLLSGALIVGGAVCLGRRIPISLTTLAAAGAGIALGLDSAPDSSSPREALLAFAGLVTGVLYLTTLISGLTVGLTKSWQRVGVRIAGSWIVAASVLVLALSIAVPAKRAIAAVGLLLG